MQGIMPETMPAGRVPAQIGLRGRLQPETVAAPATQRLIWRAAEESDRESDSCHNRGRDWRTNAWRARPGGEDQGWPEVLRFVPHGRIQQVRPLIKERCNAVGVSVYADCAEQLVS